MYFKYTAPTMATSDASFEVYEHNNKIGSIHRFFTNEQTRTPEFDINLTIYDKDNNHYRIMQSSFSMKKGGEWKVEKNDRLLGTIRNPDGFFKMHQIDIDIEDFPVFFIKATLSGKGRILNSAIEEVGQTYRTTRIERTYEGDIEDTFLGTTLPILFYGIVHTFWCGFNRQ